MEGGGGREEGSGGEEGGKMAPSPRQRCTRFLNRPSEPPSLSRPQLIYVSRALHFRDLGTLAYL